jgi:hypothetical protein
MANLERYERQAMEMVATPRVKEALDLTREPAEVRDRYGKSCEDFLLPRRLAEAGVAVVTLKVGDWDTHEEDFRDMREQLPQLDRGLHALVCDLYERCLEREVAVVMWGEFGRAPRTSRGDGRDHWPQAGAAVVAGGGFRVGQVVGAPDTHGGRSRGEPYTPSNVLSVLYRHLGIDPAATVPDQAGRLMAALGERVPVRELGPARAVEADRFVLVGPVVRPPCEGVGRMKAATKVTSGSAAEAETADYREVGDCRDK